MFRNLSGVFIVIVAFGIGVACAALWISITDENTPHEPRQEITIPASVEQTSRRTTFAPEPSNTPVSAKIEFACSDRLFSFLLSHLRRNEPELDVDGFIKARNIENCTELFTVEQRVDLNNDNRNEYVVRTNPWCGATGNCQTFIVQAKGNSYKIILDSTVEEIIVDKTKSSGFRDILSTFDLGAPNRNLTRFRFTNGKYRVKECLDEHTTIDGERSLRKLKLADCS